MQDALTVTVALAGLFFSLSCALLFEELLFGMVFRLMACSRRIAAGMKQARADKAAVISSAPTKELVI